VIAILMMALSAPALAMRRRYPAGSLVPLAKLLPLDIDAELDLPCPWCKGPTADMDVACPSCGKRFG
jgi:hypothetical protein